MGRHRQRRTKPATLETGATVDVPLFVNVGDHVRVDTRTAVPGEGLMDAPADAATNGHRPPLRTSLGVTRWPTRWWPGSPSSPPSRSRRPRHVPGGGPVPGAHPAPLRGSSRRQGRVARRQHPRHRPLGGRGLGPLRPQVGAECSSASPTRWSGCWAWTWAHQRSRQRGRLRPMQPLRGSGAGTRAGAAGPLRAGGDREGAAPALEYQADDMAHPGTPSSLPASWWRGRWSTSSASMRPSPRRVSTGTSSTTARSRERCLRLGTYEVLYEPATPVAVSIDESLELPGCTPVRRRSPRQRGAGRIARERV